MKLDFLTWFISAFCCYRLTVLISRDLGPWNLFFNVREKVRGLKCPYCISVYIGSLVSIGLYFSGFVMPVIMWFILAASFSGATIVLDRCFTSDWSPK